MSSKPTVVFSPGGFHTPLAFDNVRGILSARGFETAAVPLLTVGATDKNVAPHHDSENLHSVLSKMVDEGKEIILVGHSYSGLVISNAVEGLSIKQRASEGKQGGILIMIYLTAFVIPAGGTLMVGLDPDNLGWHDHGDGFITAKDPIDIFYADIEPSLAKKAVDALKPMPVGGLGEESRYEPWKHGFEVGYIFTEKDNALPLSEQKAMASHLPDGYFTASIACGHSPFLSNPNDVADAIQNAAEYARKKATSV